MADENKNQSQTTAPQGGGDQIGKLESDLKTAFKEGRIDDVKKISEELKGLDPENHLADRLLEKAQQAEIDALKQANAGRIKELEDKMKMAFKAGNLAEVSQLAEELKKLDPENRDANKIQSQIQEAKDALNSQTSKEKVKVLSAELKALLTDKKWDEATKKANDILSLDSKNKAATKALEKVAKENKVDAKSLVTADLSDKSEKKVGFFGRLFGKKEAGKPEGTTVAAEKSISSEPAAAKPAVTSTPAVQVPEKAPAPVTSPASESKAVTVEVKKDAPKEDIKKSEENLKLAMKEGRSKDAEVLIEAIQKSDQENKAAKKAQEKITKEKTKLEAQAKKEKIKGMTAELKEFLKNEEWEKVEKKANDMLAVDEKNKAAMKALKKMPETEKAPEKKQDEALKKEGEKPAEAVAQKPVEVKADAVAKPIAAPAVAPVVEKKAEAPKPAMPTPAKASEPVKAAEVAKPVAAPTPIATPKPVEVKVDPVTKPVAAPAVAPVAEKKPVAPKAVEAKPTTPVKSSAPMVAVPLGAVGGKKEESVDPTKASSETKEEAKGNMFTSLFGKKVADSKGSKKSESIIDTIVTQTDKAKKEKVVKKKEVSTGAGFMHFSGAFLRFAIAFIVLSAGFFYAYNIDENNRVLSMAGRENYAIQLKNAAGTLDEKQGEEKKLNKDIKRYQEEAENESIETIGKIREDRMDWPDLIKKLNEVTESVYEKNALAQYVQYNNYSYNVENGDLTVSATLSDPLGKNLTKLAEIEEAFMYYPKDKNDPNDETQPYFYGMESFNSYAKSFNATTGRYTSSFSLNISTKEKVEGKKKR